MNGEAHGKHMGIFRLRCSQENQSIDTTHLPVKGPALHRETFDVVPSVEMSKPEENLCRKLLNVANHCHKWLGMVTYHIFQSDIANHPVTSGRSNYLEFEVQIPSRAFQWQLLPPLGAKRINHLVLSSNECTPSIDGCYHGKS